ncbi:hypothetical protein PVAP13_9NG553214, partial [Panicum virgatum]
VGARAPSRGARGGTRRPGALAGAAHAPACRLPHQLPPARRTRSRRPAGPTGLLAPRGHRPPDATVTQGGRHEPLRGRAARALPFLLLPHRPLPLREAGKGAAAGRKPRVFLPRPASSALPAGPRIRTPRRRRLAPSLSR